MLHRNETIMHGKQHNIVIKGKATGVKDTVLHLDYNTHQHVVLGKLFNHFLLTYHICKRWIIIFDSVTEYAEHLVR